MGKFLTSGQRGILQEAHYSAKQIRNADRIKAILLLDDGYSYAQIARILLLDDMTVRRYEKAYKKNEIDGLLENRYHGSESLLTKEQETELKKHLRETIYPSTLEIIAYVKNIYQVAYSIEGMNHVLHRLHFSYKKTKVVPGKANPLGQLAHKIAYYILKASKKPEDKIYFVDGSHPHHNNRPYYGWIYTGEEKAIKTNSGRERINLNGALNIEDMAITVLAEETINAHAMMRLFLHLEEKQPTGEIYIILDNAGYNHAYEIELFLGDHPRIHLIYLPAYSPNLNIIERLWKYFYKKRRGKYFEKFKDFRDDVLVFFQNIDQNKDELKTLLTDSFQTLPK